MTFYLKSNGSITTYDQVADPDKCVEINSTQELFDAVEAQDTWNGTDKEVYVAALSVYDLSFVDYDDIEEAWAAFADALKAQGSKAL